MALLTAYFDAAGDNSAPHALVVGGFIGDVPAWDRFTKRWRIALDENDIEHFHMTDFIVGSEGFEKYKDRPDLQAPVLDRLTKIIGRHSYPALRWFLIHVCRLPWYRISGTRPHTDGTFHGERWQDD